ncbi:ABC transporter permease [Agromyces sp. MMS24-K17]|uniref:ABC transporter permease n=1 Tax=Agromyces sp. MMS24-K17 TaxID=3372850 RepID=UPI003754E8C3
MRVTDAARMAESGMRRNKTRTSLTVVAIAIAAFTIMLTTAIGVGVGRYLDQETASFGAADVMVVFPATDDQGDGPQAFDEDALHQEGTQFATLGSADLARMGDIDGIAEVTPIPEGRPLSIATDEGSFVLAAQMIAPGQRLALVAGDLPADRRSAEIAITPDYVTALGFDSAADAVGEPVELGVADPLGRVETVEATVSGVFEGSLLVQGRLFYSEGAQAAVTAIAYEGLDAPPAPRFAFATLADTSAAAVAGVEDDLAELGLTGQTVADQVGIVKQVFDAITAVLVAFGVIALLAAGFGVINTLYMSVQDRTREIGLMKANGLASGRVFGLFSLEATLIGLVGSAIGVLAAWGVGLAANGVAAATFLAEFPSFDLLAFEPLNVGAVIVAVMAITFLAGTLPARRAARLDPIAALRYE